MNCNKIIHDNKCNIIVQEDNYINGYAFVYILQLNRTYETISQTFIKTSEEQTVIFSPNSDGFYTLVTLKVPMNLSSEYYYYDNKFYHNHQEIELQELVEINPNVSGLEMIYDYYFQTCGLEKCFINICYQIFDSKSFTTCNTPKKDQNLIYRRDLVWSALSVIRYMIETDQYEEAERLLERILGCNGLCENYECLESHNNSNCGCNK